MPVTCQLHAQPPDSIRLVGKAVRDFTTLSYMVVTCPTPDSSRLVGKAVRDFTTLSYMVVTWRIEGLLSPIRDVTVSVTPLYILFFYQFCL